MRLSAIFAKRLSKDVRLALRYERRRSFNTSTVLNHLSHGEAWIQYCSPHSIYKSQATVVLQSETTTITVCKPSKHQNLL